MISELSVRHLLDLTCTHQTNNLKVKAHRERGNTEGWKFLDPVPVEVGAATHAFAAFDPNLRGKK